LILVIFSLICLNLWCASERSKVIFHVFHIILHSFGINVKKYKIILRITKFIFLGLSS
jgi:fumarate reductase subunit D